MFGGPRRTEGKPRDTPLMIPSLASPRVLSWPSQGSKGEDVARDGFVPLHQGFLGHWCLICMTFNYGHRVKLSMEWGWISDCGSVCLTAEVREKWRMPCRTRSGSLCWEVSTNTATRIGCVEVEDIHKLFTHIWGVACLGTSTLTSLSVK